MTASLPLLLQAPEGKTLEFKRDLSSPRNLLKTLVAFANAAGGKLVIGVDDDGQVLGVADPLDAEERLCNLIADGITPRLVPHIEFMSAGQATLLIAEVYPSSARQHHLNALGPEHGVYLRLGASNRQAGPDWIAEAHRAAAGLVFDEQPLPELSAADLDHDAMARWFGATRPLDDTRLQTLKLLRPEQGRLVPTRGAVLLFGRQREQQLIEQWGSGVRRIFAEAAAQGLPVPQVTEIATGVRFTVLLDTPHLLDPTTPDRAPSADATAQVGEQVSKQVSEQVKTMLRHCLEQPRSKQELLACLQLSNAYMNYKRHISPLVEQGLLALTLPDKPNSRLQRYRLTPQGRALIKASQP